MTNNNNNKNNVCPFVKYCHSPKVDSHLAEYAVPTVVSATDITVPSGLASV